MSQNKPISLAHLEPDQTESIGCLVRRTRRARGLSQYGLADLLAAVSGNDGVDREAVARWERGGRVPGPYWRQWLATALELPGAQLGAAARVSHARSARAARPATRPSQGFEVT